MADGVVCACFVCSCVVVLCEKKKPKNNRKPNIRHNHRQIDRGTQTHSDTHSAHTNRQTVSVLRILCVFGAVHTEKPEMLCVNLNSKLPGVKVTRFASTCLMCCEARRMRKRERENSRARAADTSAIDAAAAVLSNREMNAKKEEKNSNMHCTMLTTQAKALITLHLLTRARLGNQNTMQTRAYTFAHTGNNSLNARG